MDTSVAVSPSGQIFLADQANAKLQTVVQDGKLEDVVYVEGLRSVCVTPNGVIYLLGNAEQNLGWLSRLDGDRTVPVVSSQDLFPTFHRSSVFVKMAVLGEVLYILGWHMEDDPNDFVLKVTADGTEPVVVGRGYDSGSDLRGLLLCCKNRFTV